MFDFVEKRKFPRINAALPLRYKELHGKTYLAKGTLSTDVSKGGVRFAIDRFLALTCHLIVEVKLPSPERTVRMLSKIVWIKKLPAEEKYEIGTRFLAMTNDDELAMSSYAEKTLEASPKS